MRIVRVLFVCLLMLALVAIPAFAQGDAPPEVTPISTPVDGDVVAPIVVEDGVTVPVLHLIAILFVTVAGGGSIVVIVGRILESKEARDHSERLYQSASPTTQQMIREGYEFGRRAQDMMDRVLDYLEAITDGLPNEAIAGKAQVASDDPLDIILTREDYLGRLSSGEQRALRQLIDKMRDDAYRNFVTDKQNVQP